jgi:autoinducer 2-degrading protein
MAITFGETVRAKVDCRVLSYIRRIAFLRGVFRLMRMLIVHVNIRVKLEFVGAFKEATLENARASRREAGIARFDLIQDAEHSDRFVLIEIYRTTEAPAAHKATAHYAKWRDTVAEMMAEPRTSRKFVNIDPADAGW